VLRRQSANSPLTNSAKESRVDNVANSEPLALRDGPWMDVGLLQKHIGYTLIPEVLQRWTDVGLERSISTTCRSDAYPCERRNIPKNEPASREPAALNLHRGSAGLLTT
jgi:hypothetical protein